MMKQVRRRKKTVYDKVKYYEYEMTRYVSVSIEYAMKRNDRDEVPISNVYSHKEEDKLPLCGL